MKKTISMILFLLFSISQFTSAQTANIVNAKHDEPTSNVEKFSNRSGTLMKKDFIEIGTLKKCEIKVNYFTDLISGQKQSAVRFEYEYKSSYTSDTKIALLDADEIDGLMQSIKIMQDKVFASTPSNYTEVEFKSRSGFAAGCYSKNNTWSCYLKLERFDGNSYVWLDNQDMTVLLDLLQQAKTKL